MKVNRLITVCTMAALLLSAGTLLAQNDGGGRDDNGGRRRGGGPGGGGFGGGNFDPAQFQQRMMEGVRDRLGFTNETDWAAVQPMVQKVMDARIDVAMPGGLRFGRRGGDRGGDNPGARRGFGNQPGPEAEALQKAIDDNAPAGQIKDLLAKYKAAQKEKQAKLDQAQAGLRKVLSVKQEAQATLLGLLN
jgi:hypothetical protein